MSNTKALFYTRSNPRGRTNTHTRIYWDESNQLVSQELHEIHGLLLHVIINILANTPYELTQSISLKYGPLLHVFYDRFMHWLELNELKIDDYSGSGVTYTNSMYSGFFSVIDNSGKSLQCTLLMYKGSPPLHFDKRDVCISLHFEESDKKAVSLLAEFIQ